ncbi:MAG: hypothetical protein CMP10_19910 [Zetaproteobacteria bacterium]|nr:hypothetical protein [Pseudobdellovibrionaceae bacterium]
MKKKNHATSKELAKTLLKDLHQAGYQAMFAGGSVRDHLIGLPAKDFDIATDAQPETVSSIFKQKNDHVVPTGLNHGTVTVVRKKQPFEITTLRQDLDHDGRHATPEFGVSFEEDAKRRDFTMNGLFEDIDGKIHDFVGGENDIAQGTIRFIGDGEQRIREDYLRILRYFRFSSQLGFQPAPGTEEAIQKHRDGIKNISQERITSEFLLLLGAPAAYAALTAMSRNKILSLVLPEAKFSGEPEQQKGLDQTREVGSAETYPLSALAFILPRSMSKDQAEKLGKRLKLPKREIRGLSELLKGPSSDLIDTKDNDIIMREIDVLDEKEPGLFLDLFIPAWNTLYPELSRRLDDLALFEEKNGALRRMPMPINGQQLKKAFGWREGPEMGSILKSLRDAFRRGEWVTYEEGLKKADQLKRKS